MNAERTHKKVIPALSLLLFLYFCSCAREPDPDPIDQPYAHQPPASVPSPNLLPVPPDLPPAPAPSTDPNWSHPRSDQRLDERGAMVRHIRDNYGLDDPVVLAAMENVPRHWFVPEQSQRSAYVNSPLRIGHGQTISQPFIVALMTHLLDLNSESKVLEIGTGSGYQAAILTELTPHVYTIEILEPLGQQAQQRFQQFGYTTIQVRIGDGYQGWPEHQPFDAIIVTCAPDHIPPALLDQMKPNGKMVIPVGPQSQVQELIVVTKDENGRTSRQSIIPVRFVPMLRDETK